MENPDIVFQTVRLNQGSTLVQVVAVDVNSGDFQLFVFYNVMILFNHQAIADADIQYRGSRREMAQAVAIAMVGGTLNEIPVKSIAQRFTHFDSIPDPTRTAAAFDCDGELEPELFFMDDPTLSTPPELAQNTIFR